MALVVSKRQSRMAAPDKPAYAYTEAVVLDFVNPRTSPSDTFARAAGPAVACPRRDNLEPKLSASSAVRHKGSDSIGPFDYAPGSGGPRSPRRSLYVQALRM